MFVDIETPKSPIAVENILMHYKKGWLSEDKTWRLPREKITPDVCFEVLKSTNYARNIKDMLERVVILSKEEQAQFKEVVLATFDRREQPENIQIIGKILADHHDYRDELEALIDRDDTDFLCSAPYIKRGRRSEQKYFNQDDVFDCDKLVLTRDYAKFSQCRNLPTVLDLSACDVVRFENFYDNSLANVQKIIFAPYSMVYFYRVQGFPSHLDLSNCSGLDFRCSDLAQVEQLKMSSNACVNFDNCFHIPQNLELDKCKSLHVDGKDFRLLKNLCWQKDRS